MRDENDKYFQHIHKIKRPVSRAIQLCASRMDSLSQLHLFKRKWNKVNTLENSGCEVLTPPLKEPPKPEKKNQKLGLAIYS